MTATEHPSMLSLLPLNPPPSAQAKPSRIQAFGIARAALRGLIHSDFAAESRNHLNESNPKKPPTAGMGERLQKSRRSGRGGSPVGSLLLVRLQSDQPKRPAGPVSTIPSISRN